MKRALLWLALAVTFPEASAAQTDPAKPLGGMPLGRLFFTPAERAQLDIARSQKKAPTEAAAPAPEPVPLPQTVTYGGIVRRSDGKAMLWINNRLVEEKEALSGLNLKGRVRPDGAVTLQVPQTGASINVKVGQSVELQTGRIGEARRQEPQPKPQADDAGAPASDAKPGAPPPAAPPAAGAPAAPPAAGAPAAPPAAGAKPQEPPTAERKPEAPGTVGLKLDMGSSGKK
jgi:hypothetical protein